MLKSSVIPIISNALLLWYISSRKCYNISLFMITQLFLPLCTMAALLLLYHEGPIRDLVKRSRETMMSLHIWVIIHTYFTYLVTWVNYPCGPSGRDLNLSLKTSSDGELTTASGRLFQELTTRCEKNFDMMSVRA